MNFENKICVVTGGTGGIGRCIANEFAKRRAKVALIDLDQAAGVKALESIKANGAEGLFYCGDIAEKEVIARTVMFLCDEENSFITGQNITVDGGMTKLMIYSGDYGWEYNTENRRLNLFTTMAGKVI